MATPDRPGQRGSFRLRSPVWHMWTETCLLRDVYEVPLFTGPGNARRASWRRRAVPGPYSRNSGAVRSLVCVAHVEAGDGISFECSGACGSQLCGSEIRHFLSSGEGNRCEGL